MTRVLVAIPWRYQRHRDYAHDITARHYIDLLPDADVVDVDTSHTSFCLAGCRNTGVNLAQIGKYDVAILADADTLPEREPLHSAIEGALTSGLVHLPYTEYRSLREDGTRQYLNGWNLEHCNHRVVDNACSGVYVTTPATWWAHGGQDEKFRSWSPEDSAWFIAHKTLLGAEPVRHPGRVYALHHDSPMKDGDDFSEGYARIYRYMQADGDKEAIRALISEE